MDPRTLSSEYFSGGLQLNRCQPFRRIREKVGLVQRAEQPLERWTTIEHGRGMQQWRSGARPCGIRDHHPFSRLWENSVSALTGLPSCQMVSMVIAPPQKDF